MCARSGDEDVGEAHTVALVLPSDSVELVVPSQGMLPNARLVAAYLAKQTSPRSRSTAMEALRRIARLVARISGRPEVRPDQFEWTKLEYEQVNFIRAALAEMSRDSLITPGTANLTMSHLRSIIAVAFVMRLITPEQAALSNPKILPNIRGKREKHGRALTAPEELALRASAIGLSGFRSTMLDTIIAISVGGGLRRDEVVRLTLKSLDGDRLIVIGKGNKERRPYVDPQMREAINRWKNVRSFLEPPHDFLFCSPERPEYTLSTKSLGRLVRTAAHAAFGDRRPCSDECQCSKTVTGPHDFRRTFASRLLDLGLALNEVQQLMGHESMATTAIYDKREEMSILKKRMAVKVVA
jgi:integrase/recombinase XerD